MIPTVLSGAFVYPFVAVLSVVPFIGVVALPSLLGLTAFLIYGSAWLVYLLLAQDDLPTGVSGVFLPWSPLRCLKVDRVLLSKCRSMIQLGIPQLALDWCYRRIMVTGGRNGKKIVRENILYGSDFPGRRLDVYMPDIDPILDTSQPRDVQDPKEEGEDGGVGRELAPVLVLFGGGAWTFGNRRTYMQLALRFRRLGYVVVLPDLVSSPPPLYCPREAALLIHNLIHADDVPGGTVQGDGVRHAQGAGMDAPAHCQVRRRPGPGRIFYPQAVKDAPGTALNSDAAYADIPVRSRIGSPPLTPDRRPRGGGALSRRLLVESV